MKTKYKNNRAGSTMRKKISVYFTEFGVLIFVRGRYKQTYIMILKNIKLRGCANLQQHLCAVHYVRR